MKRKAGYPFYYRGARVVKTSLLSEATLYLADFVVSCSMECYRACCAAKVSWRPVLRQLGLRCLLHSARCSAALLATSAGGWRLGVAGRRSALGGHVGLLPGPAACMGDRGVRDSMAEKGMGVQGVGHCPGRCLDGLRGDGLMPLCVCVCLLCSQWAGVHGAL